MSLLRSALLAGADSPWLRRQATRRRFVRRAVSRFMPGESVEDALPVALALASQGMGTLLTQLGENVDDQAEAEAVTKHYLAVLDRAQAAGLDAEVSVKITQLGFDVDRDLARANLDRIAGRARALGHRLWVDMEGSAYTEATLELYREARRAHDNVGIAIQTYLHRTAQDLESLVPLGAAIRLVKGAYREPPTVAIASKHAVDENYFAHARRLLGRDARQAGVWLTLGTHDLRLIRRVQEFTTRENVPRDAYEFAMLYGIQREEQSRIAAAGYRMRILISYGAYWFPWYMRRLAERPANMLFVMRSMLAR